MKMKTINISLPPEMAGYVRRRCERDYGNTSEFFRELLRREMQRQIDEDIAFLEKTGRGPAGPGPQEIEHMLETQRRVRKELTDARRA